LIISYRTAFCEKGYRVFPVRAASHRSLPRSRLRRHYPSGIAKL